MGFNIIIQTKRTGETIKTAPRTLDDPLSSMLLSAAGMPPK